MKSEEDLYTKLLKSNDPILFMNRLSKKFFNALKEVMHSDDKYIDLKINFYTEGAAILLIKYFRKEINFSLDEIKNAFKGDKAYNDLDFKQIMDKIDLNKDGVVDYFEFRKMMAEIILYD